MEKKELGALEKIDLRNFWADEARDFTPWLAEENNLGVPRHLKVGHMS